MKAEARAKVNAAPAPSGLLSHAIFTPGYDGWMDEVDKCIATLKPDSWKGYTSATTPTRTWRAIPGAWTTRSWSIPSTRRS
jgi:hypothetical protein